MAFKNGVKVEVGEKECSIDTFIIVKHGYPISEVAKKVQESVLEAVSSLTALKVIEVNVFVQDVKIEDVKGIKDESETTGEIE